MKYIKNTTLLFLILIASSFGSFSQSDSTVVSDSTSAPVEINWLTFEEALEVNKTNPKKWMIDVSTVWCGWCKKMDANTFSDPIIIDFVNANYHAVRLDGEEKKDIEVNGTVFKFVEQGRRGYHELPAQLMGGKMSYPTIVYLNPQLQVYQSIPGYKSKSDLLPILHYINNFEQNSESWEDFLLSFESPYTD